jgi:hypothetical protein
VKQVLMGCGGLLAAAVLFVALLVFSFGMEKINLEWQKYWRPQYENVNRQVFENTESFVKGTLNNINRMRADYLALQDAEAKKALGFMILREVDQNPNVPLSADLAQFIAGLRTGEKPF